MKNQFEPIRISDLDIICPICGKPDWCSVSESGEFAFCPRTEEGSIGQFGAWGYIHRIKKNDKTSKYKKVSKSNHKINWEVLQKFYIDNYSEKFGDNFENKLEIGWDGKAYTFPVYDEKRKITGIQRIFKDRTKLFIKGSKDGIFWPIGLQFNDYLLICEGASDTLTALNLGFEAVGRLSCNNGERIICKLLKEKQQCRPIIIADSDEVGIKGAKKLAIKLLDINPASILIPPMKDLRKWDENGLTKEKLLLNIKIIEKYREGNFLND